MTHIILTGSTGTAGAAILAKCISTSSITKISVLSRRPVAQTEGVEKAHVHLHDDFTTYPASLLEQLKDATACVWALGVPTGAVSAAEYRTITHDYPVNFARALLPALSPSTTTPFNFIYISGAGATRTPGRMTQLFARVKGETEVSLLSLLRQPATNPTSIQPQINIINIRPGFIDETLAPRKEGRKSLVYRLGDRMAPVLRKVYPSGVIGTDQLGEVCVRLAIGGIEGVEGNGVEIEERGGENGGENGGEEGGERGMGVLVENVGLRRLAAVGGS